MNSDKSPFPLAENRLAICVFCGSSSGNDPHHTESARRMGTLIASNGCSLVFGGGNGLMGEVAGSVRSLGGSVTAIIPDFLHRQLPKLDNVTELIVTQTMHERKALMFQKADVFVTLPGGIGTLEETLEILTWSQLGLHRKPMILVNTRGYWDPLVACLAAAIRNEYLQPEVLEPLRVVSSPDAGMKVILNTPRNYRNSSELL